MFITAKSTYKSHKLMTVTSTTNIFMNLLKEICMVMATNMK